MHIHQRLCCPKQRVCSISVLPLYTVLSQLLYAFPTVQKVLNEQKIQRAKPSRLLRLAPEKGGAIPCWAKVSKKQCNRLLSQKNNKNI